MGNIPGVEFDFGGGRVFTMAPLSLGVIQRLQKRLENLSTDSALNPESLSTIVQATHASLKRNYPDITEEQVGDLVDVGNMLDVVSLVLDVGGFKRKAAEDAKKNHLAQPEAPTPPSTGQPL
jgi:hypothetical protein